MTHNIITLAWLLLILLCVYAITVRDDVIRNQGKRIGALHADLADALQEREDSRRMIATKDEQIRWHMRAWVLVLDDEQRRLHGEDVMNEARIIEGVEELLLEGEEL